MTYKKIAELAGVSVSTVSKVMSGSSEISPETARRILEIADDHSVAPPKYHRDRIGTRVAVIVPEVISVYYSKFITIIAALLEERNIIPVIYITNFDKKQLARIVDSITDSSIDGIISLTSSIPEKKGMPPTVLLLGYSDSHDTVEVDYSSAIFEAVEYLHKLSHTDIGFISEKHTDYKLRHFRESAVRLGIQITEKNIFVSKKRFEEIGYEAVEYFVKRKKLPTALLCAYDEIAMGAIHAFKLHGIRVPEDISVIGINDIPYASYAEIPLTTISTVFGDASSTAVQMLCERIFETEAKKPVHTLMKGELIVRSTTAPPRTVQ